MNSILRVSTLLLTACLALSILSGCSSPPANGVQIQISAKLTDKQIKKLKSKLKRLDSGISRVGHSNLAGQITINLSPVADVQAFAKKINFGQTDVSDRVIFLTVDPARIK